MMRPYLILRSTDPEAGGGPATDEFVTISRAELDELKAKAEDAGLSTRDELTEKSRTREAEHSRELAAERTKAAELGRAYKAALRDRELATALVGKPLVPGAASQLIKLWRDDFEVVDDGGEIRVLARDGREVDQAVLDRLNGPEFAHFCLPSSRGGTGTRGQNRSASAAPTPAAPRTLGEAILLKWRESGSRSEGTPAPTGWGRRR